jgi:hypothetical protein
MRFEHYGIQFSIHFQHYTKDRHPEMVPPRRSGVTYCRIIQWDSRHAPVAMLVGVAACSLKDPYVKETGRGLSLERAVQLAPPDLAKAAAETYYGRKR